MITIVYYKGGRFSPDARDSLMELDRLTPDISIRVTQGGWNSGGVAASAGTHDGDAVDIATGHLSRDEIATVVTLLRKLGWAAWYRQPGWAGRPGNAHIHAVPNGWGSPSAGAKRQAQQYRAGTNGLASHGPDNQLGATGAYRSTTWHDYLDAQKAKATPATPAPTQEDDMPLSQTDIDRIATATTTKLMTAQLGRQTVTVRGKQLPYTVAMGLQDSANGVTRLLRKLGVIK